ncbi:kynurenine formamidase-like isoform X2 [Bradysia coprophila]|uniref:kynurenine formamidase-like isoform X1 n=1 Tax=Bradysia coprophila TaxID=38358 RepID=UPI00187DB1DD|nr:kynurenine formamidase-like isoform X1 [Bradysia coprophila]XP_037051523.1 kynurenine formamidase-like isoform X2 [Bradysia coprophila]
MEVQFDYDIDWNKEFTTQAWSRRFLNGLNVQALHVEFATKESQRVQSVFQYETISYGANSNENYDIYGVDLPSDAPVFVYIHGGFWKKLSKSISAYCVDPLVTAGIKVIVLEYDLCPNVTLSALVEQVTRFGEFILKKSDYVTSRRISFAGHSAGAHLILCMIDQLLNRMEGPLRIDSIYLISGVYDLTHLQHTTSVNQDNCLSLNSDNVDQLSPLKFDYAKWSEQRININIYVGEHETPTFIKQSMEMFLRFVTGFRVRMRFILDHDHFNIVENLSEKSYELTQDIVSEK